MRGQVSFFDGDKPLKIKKPIRLIELFAGIGSQAAALRNLGVPFEHYRICEFDKFAVKSYNAIHGTNFEVSDITQITAEDLDIIDTNNYTYIMTYSFPCQDLSKAGKQKGLGKGTRSGLLWEVERLLNEMYELPQILLMENVPDVLSSKFIKDFADWIAFLDSKGYTSKYQILNAKNYGVPQNRERCFMMSWLGDYYYEFPEPIPLKKRLKDVLENEVNKKYYLSDSAVEKLIDQMPAREVSNIARSRSRVHGTLLSKQAKHFDKYTDCATTIMARDYKGFGNQAMNGVIEYRSNQPKPSQGADGLYLQTSPSFTRQPLKNVSRALKAEQHDAGVIEYG